MNVAKCSWKTLNRDSKGNSRWKRHWGNPCQKPAGLLQLLCKDLIPFKIHWKKGRDWTSAHSMLSRHMLHMTASVILSLVASCHGERAKRLQGASVACESSESFGKFARYSTFHIKCWTDIKKLDTLTRVSLHHKDSSSDCHIFWSSARNPPTLKDWAWISQTLGDRPIISPRPGCSCCEENLHIVWDTFGQLSWM